VLSLLPSFSKQGEVNSAVISYSSQPRNLQFFARDTQDSALVSYSGTLISTGYDSVYIEVFRNNVFWKRKSSKLLYFTGSAQFNIGAKIKCELAEYKFRF
jgi:hypothetical protein